VLLHVSRLALSGLPCHLNSRFELPRRTTPTHSNAHTRLHTSTHTRAHAQHGVICLLDAVCREPNPSDAKYVKALHLKYATSTSTMNNSTLSANALFPPVHKKDQRDSFAVQHYAGVVKYTADGAWCLRNNDRIPEDYFVSTAATAAVGGGVCWLG
jgi:Myosin head (motor domain)